MPNSESRRFFAFFAAVIILAMFAGPVFAQPERPDVLLIMVDDLRPMLGCYRDAHIRTPNIDETLISLRFTPDERSLVVVTGSYNFQQRLQLLDPRTLKFQREFKTHTGLVKSYEYTPDGKLLAVGTSNTRDYYIQLIDPGEGKLIRRWRVGDHGTGRGVRLAISPDGQTVASVVNDMPDVKLWDTATGEERSPRKEGTTAVERMMALSDGQTLVTQDEDGRVL